MGPPAPCPHPHPAAQGMRAGQMLGRAATGTSTSLELGIPAALGCLTTRGTRAGQGSCSAGGRGQLPAPGASRSWMSPLANAGTLVPTSSCCWAVHWQTCAQNSSSQPACSSSSPWGCTTVEVGRTPAQGPPGTLASGVPRDASLGGCQHPWGCQFRGQGIPAPGSLEMPAQGSPQMTDSTLSATDACASRAPSE